MQVGPLTAGVGTNQAVVPNRNGIGDPDWRGDASQYGQFFPGSAIVGVPATLQDGSSFGTVRDCIVSDSGCIEYAIVNYGNRLVPVPGALRTSISAAGRSGSALRATGSTICRHSPTLRN